MSLQDPSWVAWTYILRCSDGSYYVGSTIDLDRRLWQHQQGVGAAYTRRRRPVELVWNEFNPDVREAYRAEKQIQGWSRAKREALIEGRVDDLPGMGWNYTAARRGDRGRST